MSLSQTNQCKICFALESNHSSQYHRFEDIIPENFITTVPPVVPISVPLTFIDCSYLLKKE
jgi:hypothetical protein